MQSDDLTTSLDLFARYELGESAAADQIFHRYLERLTRLARSRLSSRLAGRLDAEDVVLSVWRSFFAGASLGQYTLERSGDLWQLLVTITLHKLFHQVRFHQAEMRTVLREESLEQSNSNLMGLVNREPSPEEAIEFSDELASIMRELDSERRRILELRLQGELISTIADETGRSQRTVRRLLKEIRRSISKRLEIQANER